jgi:hypothetical protein
MNVFDFLLSPSVSLIFSGLVTITFTSLGLHRSADGSFRKSDIAWIFFHAGVFYIAASSLLTHLFLGIPLLELLSKYNSSQINIILVALVFESGRVLFDFFSRERK